MKDLARNNDLTKEAPVKNRSPKAQAIGYFCCLARPGVFNLIFLIFLWSNIAQAQTIPAPAYTNEQIANAIYFAEGGKRAKVPYGILSVKVKDEAEARKVCLNTIRNNRKRFALQTKYTDFIEFLGSRYCPISAHKLNRYWVGNVKRLLERQE